MLFKSILSLAVAGLASANIFNFEVSQEHHDAERALEEYTIQHQEDIRIALAQSDSPTVIKFLDEFNTELSRFDQIIADITKANAKSQMDKWVAQGKKLAEVADRAAPAIKASPPVNLAGLLGPGTKFFSIVNSTFYHIVDRRQIIIDAGLQNKVKESLINGKHAMIAMAAAFPGQVPPAVYDMIVSITGIKLPPAPTAESLAPLIDRAVDYIFKVFTGEVQLPKSRSGGKRAVRNAGAARFVTAMMRTTDNDTPMDPSMNM